MASLYKLELGEVVEFHRVLHAAGLDAERARRVVANPDLAAAMIAALNPQQSVVRRDTYLVPVNYDLTVAKAIRQCRFNGYVNPDITDEHFKSVRHGKATVEMRLEHPNRMFTSEQGIEYLDAKGLRPADLWELLAFAKKYPNLQLEFPILGLGSIWTDPDGHRDAPCLNRYGGQRVLFLNWVGPMLPWGVACRVLAVSKLPLVP